MTDDAGRGFVTRHGWVVRKGMKLLPVGGRRVAAMYVEELPADASGSVVLSDMTGRRRQEVPLFYIPDRFKPAG